MTESQLIFSFDWADPDNIAVSIPNNSHNSATAVSVSKDGAGANNQVMANTSPDAPEEKEKKSGFGRKEKSVLQTKLTRLAIQIGYAGEWGILGVYRYLHPDCLGGQPAFINTYICRLVTLFIGTCIQTVCLGGQPAFINTYMCRLVTLFIGTCIHTVSLSGQTAFTNTCPCATHAHTCTCTHTHARTHKHTKGYCVNCARIT